jgi:hypothetical protein
MKIQSAKNKGRRLTAYIREKLLEWAPDDLKPGDIQVPAGSQPGADLWLSPKAKEIYPFCIEAKNTETIQIWAAYKQAERHKKDPAEIPIVVYTRNHADVMVTLKFDDFLKLIR